MKGSKRQVWQTALLISSILVAVLLPVQGVEASVTVSTLAGSGAAGFADGAGAGAQFDSPIGIAVDSSGTVYVADAGNHRIRRVLLDGTVSTLAGSGIPGFADGAGVGAQFNFPYDVAVDSSGTVYVADTGNHRIRRVLLDGTVSTLAGSGLPGFADGAGAGAQFDFPYGIAVDSSGTVYVADAGNYRIRKIQPDGTVSTLAGSGTRGFADGAGTAAQFNYPQGIAVDSTGTVYVADAGNHRIRKIQPDGTVSTLAGSGTRGFADGAGTGAKFNFPYGVAVDSTGTVYVADWGSNRIRRILPDGTVITLAGSGTTGFVDGAGAGAQFNSLAGVAVDSTGTVYVGDSANNRIRRIAALGQRSDFNGDGKSDILWRDTTNGDTVIWLMNGMGLVAGGSLGTVPLAYTIAGIIDFNGDGKSDILWRNTMNGDTVIWLMNGLSLVGGGSLGMVPLAYTITGVGDYNADGKSDILWRYTDGTTVMWLMNGMSILAGGSLGVVPGNWSIQQ